MEPKSFHDFSDSGLHTLMLLSVLLLFAAAVIQALFFPTQELPRPVQLERVVLVGHSVPQ